MRKYIVLATAFVLTACANNNDSPNSDSSEALKPTESYQVKQGPALTEDQKNEIRSSFAKFENMPGMHLLMVYENESAESQKKHQKEIAEMGEAEKQVYEKIRKDCQIDTLKPVSTGSAERMGSKKTEKTVGEISGANCPISHRQVEDSETMVTSSNIAEVEAEYKKTRDIKAYDKLIHRVLFKSLKSEKTEIVAADLQSQVGLKNINKSLSMTNNYTKMGASTTIRTKMSGEVKFITVSGSAVTLDIKMDELRPEGKEKDSDYYSEITLHFPSSVSTIQVFRRSNAESQIYLNGKLVTSEELKAIFGAISLEGN